MHCGTVLNPIRQMETEHEAAGAALAQMRALTGGYAPPADACPTFMALYDALRELEDDLHEHIHLENNILFPRSIAMAGNA
jgi:regulator of cell morphogenesis and NO signaling